MLLAISLIFLTSVFFFYYLLAMFFVKEKYVDRIVESENEVYVEEKKMSKKKNGTIFSGVASKMPKLNRGRDKLEAKLVKADLGISIEEIFIYKVISSFVLSFAIFAIRRDYFLSAVIIIIVWQIPGMLINKRIKTRSDDFNAQLTSGINLISNALKAGHSFLQAISIAARETEGVFSDEFKILLKEMNFGITIEQSLKNLLLRVDSKDLTLIVNAILIQKDIGGNLSEILENISETIRERQKIKNEMKTLTAQGKMSGGIIMFLPIFLGGIIYLINRDYIMLLFTTSVGRNLIGISIINEIIGVFFIKKIITIEM